jgi:hypothetical protein
MLALHAPRGGQFYYVISGFRRIKIRKEEEEENER